VLAGSEIGSGMPRASPAAASARGQSIGTDFFSVALMTACTTGVMLLGEAFLLSANGGWLSSSNVPSRQPVL
jgi:hypothetical protein